MENMLDDPKDQEIMRHLLENPEGLKRVDLRRKSNVGAKRTFDSHLNYLIGQDLVEKEKDPNKGKNSTTILKAKISDKEKKSLSTLLEIKNYAKFLLSSKLPKKTKMALSSHYLFCFSLEYFSLTLAILSTLNEGMIYDTGLKILRNQLIEFKQLLNKHFKPKDIDRILYESSFIYEVHDERNDFIMRYLSQTTKNSRTLEEINLDYCIPFILDARISKNPYLSDRKSLGDLIPSVLDTPKRPAIHKRYNKFLDKINSENKKLFEAIADFKVYSHFSKESFKTHSKKSVRYGKAQENDIDKKSKRFLEVLEKQLDKKVT